jgi:hypothetical protein
MGRLFFMLDIANQLYVQKLPTYNYDDMRTLALESLNPNPIKTSDYIGCNIGDYANFMFFERREFQEISHSYDLYFVIFQCNTGYEQSLRIA